MSNFFTHKRGLRQGDPLSPMLFIIAANVLQRMVQEIDTSLQFSITAKIHESVMALQYADDTALIANVTNNLETVIKVKIALRLFTKISGLSINYNKSCFVLFNLSPEILCKVAAVLGCPEKELPITYLGMPLTVKRPNRALYLPFIEKIEKRCEGWKRKLISRGGRLQLVKSVLSAILVYYMCCFTLPVWVIDRIDRIRRSFLWGKNEVDKAGISLINWEAACLPKKWGGMGIIDLRVQNTALLLRWWWRQYEEPTALWTITVTKLRCTGTYTNGPKFWAVKGSFFWNQLQKLKKPFQWSTGWIIGNGAGISFWQDSWSDTPLIGERQTRPPSPFASLRDAIPLIHILAQIKLIELLKLF